MEHLGGFETSGHFFSCLVRVLEMSGAPWTPRTPFSRDPIPPSTAGLKKILAAWARSFPACAGLVQPEPAPLCRPGQEPAFSRFFLPAPFGAAPDCQKRIISALPFGFCRLTQASLSPEPMIASGRPLPALGPSWLQKKAKFSKTMMFF
jgi:hypothetical protein